MVFNEAVKNQTPYRKLKSCKLGGVAQSAQQLGCPLLGVQPSPPQGPTTFFLLIVFYSTHTVGRIHRSYSCVKITMPLSNNAGCLHAPGLTTFQASLLAMPSGRLPEPWRILQRRQISCFQNWDQAAPRVALQQSQSSHESFTKNRK